MFQYNGLILYEYIDSIFLPLVNKLRENKLFNLLCVVRLHAQNYYSN